jgi:nicotinic acid mononucleotide adenylyltransferase
MKTYKQFILEYRGSRAAEKAYRLGLSSDSHGNWLDRAGNIIARTVKGDLEMIRKKSPSPEKATPPPTPTSQQAPEPSRLPPPVEPTPIPKQPQEPAPPQQEQPNELTVVFGRFNPPTIGHKKLIDQAFEIASGGAFKIYPSRTSDSTKNPLNADQKVKYMRKMFPKYKDNIINDDDARTIFDVLIRAQEDGFNKINIVVGSDRVSEFDRLAAEQNGKLYNFDEINVVPSRSKDPDSLTAEGESASKMRKAALEDDFPAFQAGMPKTTDPKLIRALFFAVQRVLQGGAPNQEISKGERTGKLVEMWKYAPKLDPTGLREAYYKGDIFQVGEIVENLNTGLVGKIKRRGPNYLICVTEDDIMFKSWIKDINEWVGHSTSKNKFIKHTKSHYDLKESSRFLKKYRKSINNFIK